MPGLRVAINSGSWSNPAIWDFGLLPGPGDVVCANGFIVNIDQDVNIATLTNRASSATATNVVMTSNTTPSGYQVSASTANGSLPAWYAFDNSTSTQWQSTATPAWIVYKFPSGVVVNRYAFLGAAGTVGRTPNNWTFEGSNDGVNWTIIQTVTGGGPAISTYYTSGLLGNTTAYLYYRFNISQVVTPGNLTEMSNVIFYEENYTTLSGVAGGGFILSSSNNITLTGGGLIGGTGTCLLFSGSAGISSSLTTTAIVGPDANSSVTLRHNGAGTLTVACTSYSPAGTGTNRNTITFTSNGILNYSGGNISGNFSTTCFVVTGTGTINIVANVSGGSNVAGLDINANATINITGNVTGGGNSGRGISITSNSTTNITGNVSVGSDGSGIVTSAGCIINITGNVSGGTGRGAVDTSTTATRLNIIGSLTNAGYPAITSTGGSAINLLSGPFISQQYGGFPYYVTRMHLIPTLNNYIEYRDNSTNGALSPGPIASASRMVSADTIIDAPLASNVRFGVSYGNGAFTGTCRIPSPSNVSLNVPFDTGSTGTAFLSSNDITQMGTNIWNIPVANLTGSNTIGQRMANSSTVDTMGNQLASLL